MTSEPRDWQAIAVGLEMELKHTQAEVRRLQDKLMSAQRHVGAAALHYELARIELGKHFLGGDHQGKINECVEIKNFIESIRDRRLQAAKDRSTSETIEQAT